MCTRKQINKSSHELLREEFLWGTNGKYHNEPLRWILLKNISDSHLLHIIAWITKYRCYYTKETFDIMIEEQIYRTENYIFVPEYEPIILNVYVNH